MSLVSITLVAEMNGVMESWVINIPVKRLSYHLSKEGMLTVDVKRRGGMRYDE